MKGMVFTHFLAMVEERFSFDTVDAIIDRAELPHGGAYTAVGTYPHEEMVALVVALSAETGISVDELLKTYGRHLFGKLSAAFPHFMEGSADSFQFLAGLDGHIHVEVRKLYPDAELPRFSYRTLSEGQVEMVYHSSRHLETLAVGLMEGCFQHFHETITIEPEPMENGDVRFVLTRQAAK
jgi:hypothetical protein